MPLVRHVDSNRQRSRQLFREGGVVVGQYVWEARRAGIRRDSWIGPFPLIAIPWTAVRITHQGRAPAVGASCTGIFYKPNTSSVAEQLLDDQPERTVYIVPDRQTLRACLSEIDERS